MIQQISLVIMKKTALRQDNLRKLVIFVYNLYTRIHFFGAFILQYTALA